MDWFNEENYFLYEKLIEKNIQISEELFKADLSDDTIGLYDGLSGVMLYHALSYEVTKEKSHQIRIEEIVEMAIKRIKSVSVSASFCSGLAGFGWFMEYLNSLNIFEFNTDAFLPQFDDYLVKISNEQNDHNYIDFLHGSMGITYYFLFRWRNTKNHKLKNKYFKIVKKHIDHIVTISISKNSDTFYWKTLIDIENNYCGINFGLAHGMPSIIRILQCVVKYQFPIDIQMINDLILKSNRFIFAHKNSNEKISQYPSWIIEGEFRNYSRLGWCYGDFGISTIYYNSDNQFFKKAGLDILKRTTKRTSLSDTSIEEGSFCHGAFGVAYMYLKMYNQTKLEEYMKSSLYWYEKGLLFGNNNHGYAGYKTRIEGENQWGGKYDLLTGIAGIGIAILSVTQNIRSDWDSCMLLS